MTCPGTDGGKTADHFILVPRGLQGVPGCQIFRRDQYGVRDDGDAWYAVRFHAFGTPLRFVPLHRDLAVL